VLSGEPGPSTDVICLLAGSTRPLPSDRLAELYSSTEDYERAHSDAVDEAIEAGFVLDDDRVAIEAYAKPDLVGS
jgi:hypothetical protein